MIRRCEEKPCNVPAVMVAWEEGEAEAQRSLYCAEHGDELAAAGDGLLFVRLIPANSPLDVPDDLVGSFTIPQRQARERHLVRRRKERT